jgi:signal transduction histidine kinase
MQSSHFDLSESPDSALVTHLQASVELDKASLVKELHDNLGGLMVAALMDITWAEENFSSRAAAALGRLARVRETLRSAINIKRRIIEELRPSLLDNVGLFAAISRELTQTCARTGLRCSGDYPQSEMHFTPETSIALFRIAQEALSIANTHPSLTKAAFSVSTERETMTLRFASDDTASPLTAVDRDNPIFGSMLHRIRVLGGNLDFLSLPSNGSAMIISIPIARALLTSA